MSNDKIAKILGLHYVPSMSGYQKRKTQPDRRLLNGKPILKTIITVTENLQIGTVILKSWARDTA